MLMWEICSGKPPLSQEDHSLILSAKICQGFRPEIEEGIPKCYVDMMKLCWDADPTKRPTSKDLYETLYSWLHEPTKDLQQQFQVAEMYREKTANEYDPIEAGKRNPGAIYHSRSLRINKGSTSYSRSGMNDVLKITLTLKL